MKLKSTLAVLVFLTAMNEGFVSYASALKTTTQPAAPKTSSTSKSVATSTKSSSDPLLNLKNLLADPKYLECIGKIGPQPMYNRIAAGSFYAGLKGAGQKDTSGLTSKGAKAAMQKTFASFASVLPQKSSQPSKTMAAVMPTDPATLRYCFDIVDMWLQGETPCINMSPQNYQFCVEMYESLGGGAPAASECAALPEIEAAECALGSNPVGWGIAVGAAGFATGVCIEGCITGGGPGDGVLDLCDLFCGQAGRNWANRHLPEWFP